MYENDHNFDKTEDRATVFINEQTLVKKKPS